MSRNDTAELRSTAAISRTATLFEEGTSSRAFGEEAVADKNSREDQQDGTLDPISIFDRACREFRSSLSDKQRELFQEYPNAESMIQAVMGQAKSHPSQKSVLMRCCKIMASLATKLEPFFEVINLFVSSHPEFAALAWGSLRLVFVLGINHAQFLEGVCDLFKAMSQKLPVYETFIDAWDKFRPGRQLPTRMARAMGYIYADLIQFSFDICQIFSRKRSKFLSLRGSFMRSLYKASLNPFNVRFDTLLKRWEQHQQLFELEMAALGSMEQMEATEKISIILNKLTEVGMFETEQHKTWRSPEYIESHIYRWINAPSWVNLFESAQRQREMDSTAWFIDHELVTEWMPDDDEGAEKQESGPYVQVLSVQGKLSKPHLLPTWKPGFGKTTLCTTLIETLQRRLRVDDQHGRRTAFAFFYFDKQRQESVSNGAVWRAVLMQLLHTMRGFDPDVLDAILLFRETRSVGQVIASDNEIFSMLCLLAQRLDRLVLVVDGVDECEDQMHFWQRVEMLVTKPTASRVALFSRPTVTLPSRMSNSITTLSLESSQNLEDICLFLRPRLSNIAGSGLLPGLFHVDSIVHQAARRANGMFLWAALFIEYLQSPFLSSRERQNALHDLNWLEGLDLLYRAILKTLSQRAGPSRSNTIHAFESVLNSARPLHVTELHHLIAVPLNRRLDPGDLIPAFSRNLGSLSGALMELDQGGFVRFVHLSVIEYLSDYENRGTDHCESFPDIAHDRHRGQASLASRCLSYLSNTVEAEPLAGSSRAPPDRGMTVRKYPLLDYATEFWSSHVLEHLEAVVSTQKCALEGRVIELASKFLSNERAVMAWIEASWMFGRPPHVRNGPHDIFFKSGLHTPSRLEQKSKQMWKTAWATLLQLANDLASINSSWAHVLKNEPNEIWEPSISAFHESPFWQRVSGSKVIARFDARPDPSSAAIHLKTRLSTDGTHLGIIRLYVSRSEMIQNAIFFELWSVKPNAKLGEVEIRIPRNCLKPFLQSQTAGMESESLQYSFQCPSAFTSDLRRIVVPGSVVNVPRFGDDDDTSNDMVDLDDDMQFIDFTGNAWRNRPFEFGIDDFQLIYDLQLSDDGRFLMTVHKSNGLVDVRPNKACHMRLVTVYEDISTNGRNGQKRPSYRHCASLSFKPVYTNDREGDWCALLSATAATVTIKYQSTIVVRDDHKRPITTEKGPCDSAAIWHFQASAARSIDFVESCRSFSSGCDNISCGVHVLDRTKLASQRGDPYTDSLNSNTSTAAERQSLPLTMILALTQAGQTSDSQVSYLQNRPPVQRAGEISKCIDESGLRTMSQLNSSTNGNVILATVREDGVMKAEMLTRLPKSIAEDHEATLLTTHRSESSRAPDSRAIFLDRADQPFRMHHIPIQGEIQRSQEQLPLLIRRDIVTIPKIVSGETRVPGMHGNLTYVPRKRLGQHRGDDGDSNNDSDEHSKRRRVRD